MSNLTSLIGSVIATDPSFSEGRVLATASAMPGTRPRALRATQNAAIAVATAPSKQILQLNALPVTITAARYANAFSSANPSGTLSTAYALRLLVDPVPDFTHYYNPSPSSTDQVYGSIVQSAVAQTTSPFATQILAGAQASFSRSAFAQLDGTPGTWHLVEASPFDWWDASLTDRFQPASVDFANPSSDESPFLSIGTQAGDAFSWQIVDSGGKVTQVPLSSTLANVSFRFLRVTLTRSWLSFTLFQTHGWNLPGQAGGFISSGNNQTNDGIFPLLPTGFVLGTEVAIDAHAWSSSDQQVIAQAQAGKVGLSVGPFAIAPPPLPATKSLVKLQGTTLSSAALQIIGWISALVPSSPTS